MAKLTTKKKLMTLEDFAMAIQKDYAAIRKDMATKGDLYALSQKMVTREEFRDLRSDVKMITDTMVTKADLANTLGEELAKSEYARHIDDLRARVGVLEQKLGVKPTR